MKKSAATTTTKSNQELQLIKDQDIFISNLMQGRTLTECITDKKINQQQISFQKFYAILKKNPDLEGRILEARKIGIQTLIDKLMQITVSPRHEAYQADLNDDNCDELSNQC